MWALKEFTNANSILLHIIDVRAPWRNGRTERHGDIYKRIFELARWMHSPSSSVALQRLAVECNAAKNRLSNRSGYSHSTASVRDWAPSSSGVGLWCTFVCHSHLAIILCCVAVWAQACGLGYKTTFCHYRSSLVHVAPSFVVVVGGSSITILLFLALIF